MTSRFPGLPAPLSHIRSWTSWLLKNKLPQTTQSPPQSEIDHTNSVAPPGPYVYVSRMATRIFMK